MGKFHSTWSHLPGTTTNLMEVCELFFPRMRTPYFLLENLSSFRSAVYYFIGDGSNKVRGELVTCNLNGVCTFESAPKEGEVANGETKQISKVTIQI
jgi:hypothetical protein